MTKAGGNTAGAAGASDGVVAPGGQANNAGGGGGDAPDEVQPEPLDMRFPRHGVQKQLTYLALFPIIFPLWLTLPDTRAQKCKSRQRPC